MENNLVKQDINFMEYPLWMQNEELANKAEDGFIWKDRDGYIYRAGYKAPVKTDFVFLLYLLLQSQKADWEEFVISTKHKVLKGCGIRCGKDWYKRLEDSLDRWQSLNVKFEGTFYDKKEYKTLTFGIIDSWGIEKKTRKLKVRFSPEWLLKIKESNYFKYINFNQLKSLRSPLNIRLYEILTKSFQGRKYWEIDAMKLALKIPMNEKYPSDIISKIKPAINRINEHTDLNIKLIIRRPQRGKAILIFENITDEKAKKALPKTAGLPEDDSFKSLISLLPTEHLNKKTLLEVISKAYINYGFDYVKWNIIYTNKKSTGNYRAYFNKALKENYGKGLKEDEEDKQELNKKETKALEISNLKSQQESTKRDQDNKLLMELYNSLSTEAQQEINDKIVNSLNIFEKSMYSRYKMSGDKEMSIPLKEIFEIKRFMLLRELRI